MKDEFQFWRSVYDRIEPKRRITWLLMLLGSIGIIVLGHLNINFDRQDPALVEIHSHIIWMIGFGGIAYVALCVICVILEMPKEQNKEQDHEHR